MGWPVCQALWSHSSCPVNASHWSSLGAQRVIISLFGMRPSGLQVVWALRTCSGNTSHRMYLTRRYCPAVSLSYKSEKAACPSAMPCLTHKLQALQTEAAGCQGMPCIGSRTSTACTTLWLQIGLVGRALSLVHSCCCLQRRALGRQP